ncbi:UNVERIFIED_CONTAM: hypothetical protein FKN15_050080 [Acipenser sinensis]
MCAEVHGASQGAPEVEHEQGERASERASTPTACTGLARTRTPHPRTARTHVKPPCARLGLEIASYLITFDKHEEWLSCSLKTRPQNGSIIVYNRKKVKYRNDGYCWKKRKDGKTTREDHMKLKVQGMEVSGAPCMAPRGHCTAGISAQKPFPFQIFF